MKTAACGAILLLAAGAAPAPVSAGPVNNGNELALEYSTEKTPAAREEIKKGAIGELYFFRYLKITRLLRDAPAAKAVACETVEPSSDAVVTFVVTKKESLKIAATLQSNDCVAVSGRIEEMKPGSPATIRLDPVILRYKDREAPKRGRELLPEVDSAAK